MNERLDVATSDRAAQERVKLLFSTNSYPSVIRWNYIYQETSKYIEREERAPDVPANSETPAAARYSRVTEE
jgi:hypothetical protein